MSWSTVEEAIAAFKRGQFVMVMDGKDREDECDLVLPGETTTTEQMAFMIRHTTGIVCVVAEQARLQGLGLHPATGANTDRNGTNFYVSTDYLPGTSTGVSAEDRARTVRAMSDMSSKAEDFSKPGHMFPLCPRPGGVVERAGHTESTYDLLRLSGHVPVGILAELMHDDGTMYRRDDSLEFGRRHGFPIITVEQLIEHCRGNPQALRAPPLRPAATAAYNDSRWQGSSAAAAAAPAAARAAPRRPAAKL